MLRSSKAQIASYNRFVSASASAMEAATPPPSKKTKSIITTSANGTPLKKATPKKAATAVAVTPELQQKAQRIAQQLGELHPSPPIPLDHSSTFQLLVAVILSAQTTDKKVNEVTPHLFKRAPDAAAMACMEVADIQAIIQPIGLAPTKAKNLSNMSKLLLERHGGEVPGSFAELEALHGVGHKTASVVMSQAFGHPAFPVDTHIHRLAARWGLSSGKSVEQTEADLKALLPPSAWRDVHLQIIYFGREHCPAKQHDPKRCPICSWAATGAAGSSTGSTDDIAPAASKKPTAVKKRKATAAVAAATADVAGQAAAVAVVVTAAGEGSSGVAASGVGRSSRRRSTRARKQ